MKLPCEACTKTSNHCCKADIPLGLLDALHMKYLMTEKYKILEPRDVLIESHPNEQPNMYFVMNISGITKGSEVDIRLHNCVALIDGKCSVYEDRPNICRQYGTDFMRCRFECSGISSEEDIARFTLEDIKRADNVAFSLSPARDIKPFDR